MFISQLFDPEYSIKGLSLMRHWVEKGHDVQVLTTFPNYPTGKVFSDYKVKFKQEEYIDGVKIIRLWSHISHSKSKLSRAFTYMSFTLMALFTALFSKKFDLIYTYHPQATTGLIGLVMRYLRRTPFVTDVQDLWPDALIATGMNKSGLAIRLIDKWCRLVYRDASQVVVLSEGFKDALVNRGVDEEKISIVYNWCPEEERIAALLIDGAPPKTTLNEPAHLIYAGNMGAAQSLKVLVDAVSSFSDDTLKMSLYGGGLEKEELSKHVKNNDITNVHINGYVASTEIFRVLKQADILAVHLKDDFLFRITIPSKTQSSMAMGKPILMAVGGEVNQIIENCGAGYTARPGNVDSIKQALQKFIANRSEWDAQGQKAREFYMANFSISVNYQKLDTVLLKATDNEC